MLNPIKRVFVPKAPAAVPAAAPEQPQNVRPKPRFDELPSPEMEEKDSDSIWAEFDSVKPLQPRATPKDK
jgi:hypothetical protein